MAVTCISSSEDISMSSSHSITAQEGKEEDNAKKIITHGVQSEKETILEAEAAKAEEEKEKHALNQANADDSDFVIAQEGKEKDTTKKIMTHGVWSDKEMILEAATTKAKEEAEKHAFDKANAEGLEKVMSAMAMAPKDPLEFLAEVTENSTYPSRPHKKE